MDGLKVSGLVTLEVLTVDLIAATILSWLPSNEDLQLALQVCVRVQAFTPPYFGSHATCIQKSFNEHALHHPELMTPLYLHFPSLNPLAHLDSGVLCAWRNQPAPVVRFLSSKNKVVVLPGVQCRVRMDQTTGTVQLATYAGMGGGGVLVPALTVFLQLSALQSFVLVSTASYLPPPLPYRVEG